MLNRPEKRWRTQWASALYMHVTMALSDTTLKMASRSPPPIAGLSSPAPVTRRVRATVTEGPRRYSWAFAGFSPVGHTPPRPSTFSSSSPRQRAENGLDLNDIEVSIRQNIDSTGLVCQWPSEDVLAYFCFNHANMFRSKRVLELGSGYGMAVLAIAACTGALEVVISDGNRQVVNYIQRNIHANKEVFGNTKVMSLALRWDETEAANIGKVFDIIIASDCTFFKECHEDLVLTIKFLLKSSTSEALFFSPRRGDSLDKFLMKIEEIGLQFTVTEKHDEKVWHLHTKCQNGHDYSWPNYDPDHCYPHPFGGQCYEFAIKVVDFIVHGSSF